MYHCSFWECHSHFIFVWQIIFTKSKFSELKKKYNVFNKLKNLSGFGWDDEKQIPTADDATWEAYIEIHSEAKAFRKATLPNYDALDALFSGKVATGKYAKSSAESTNACLMPIFDEEDDDGDVDADTNDQPGVMETPR